MLEGLVRHAREGTLVEGVQRRARKWGRLLGMKRPPKGDVFRGREAKEYVGKRLGTLLYRAEQNAVARILKDVPNGVSVLDVPFGTGRFVPFYLEKEMIISGLDSSPDMISAASDELGEKFASCNILLGDATTLPYADESFDLVVSVRFLGAIVSFGQAKRALQEFARVSKRYFILSINQRNNDAFRWRYPRDRETMGGKLDADEIAATLRESGFRIVRKEGPLLDDGRRVVYMCLCEKS